MDGASYKRGVVRNLHEVQRAILNRTTLVGLEQAQPFADLFLKLTYFALFNDYIAHAIKVLELNIKRTASFWALYNYNPGPVDAFAQSRRIDLASLKQVAEKLRVIRNKTHFHIDADRVFDPKAVWNDAGLTGRALSKAVDDVWDILNHLDRLNGGAGLALPSYTGDIASRVAKLIEHGG